MVSAGKPISNKDVSTLLRMCNTLHELAGDPVQRKMHFLSSLATLVEADVSICILNSTDGSLPRTSPGLVIHHAPEPLPVAMQQYLQTGLPIDPVVKFINRRMKAPGRSCCTVRREDVIDDRTWYAAKHVTEVRRPSRLDAGLYSTLRLPDADLIAELLLLRSWNCRQRFTDRHVQLTNLFHEESAWIYRAEFPFASAEVLSLTPRQQQTLQYLLAGYSEKQIAARLTLSPNTVHHYVKQLHKRFGVTSRAELLARWVRPMCPP